MSFTDSLGQSGSMSINNGEWGFQLSSLTAAPVSYAVTATDEAANTTKITFSDGGFASSATPGHPAQGGTSASSPPPSMTPTAPLAISAVVLRSSDRGVTASWASVKGASTYRVTLLQTGKTVTTFALSASFSGLGNDSPQRVTVQAVGANGVSASVISPVAVPRTDLDDVTGDGKGDLLSVSVPGSISLAGRTLARTLRGDVPLELDETGSGKSTVGIFRPSTGRWFVTGAKPVTFGKAGDVPVPGDYNGDGKTELAVFRPSTGQFLIKGQRTVSLGRRGDIPVPGDYAGTGRTVAAVWRPSTGQWIVAGQKTIVFGRRGDIPVPGDFSGGGNTEISVWRASTGQWLTRGLPTVTLRGAGGTALAIQLHGDGVDDRIVVAPNGAAITTSGPLGRVQGHPLRAV